MKKKLLLCAVLTAAAVTAAALPSARETESVRIENWSATGNSIQSVQVETYPLTVRTGKPESADDAVTLSGTFFLSDVPKDGIGLILYKNLMAYTVYVNDIRIDSIGRTGPDFFFQPYITRGVLIPASVLQPQNTIRLEIWNDTGTYKIRMLDFVNADDYEKSMQLFGFLDIQLPRFACVMLLFVAVYSFFMFINYRSKKEFLHLALAAFLFSIYLLNVTVYDFPGSYVLMKAFLYSCFPASMLFVIRFFRRFFGIKTSKPFRIAINAVGIVFIAGYYLQRSTAGLDAWHSVMLLYPVTAISFGTVGFFKSLKTNGIRNLGIGVGLVAAIAFSAYDMYYFVFDYTPFVLLQGIGFMGLILGTFYSISQEVADTNRKCILFAEELEAQSDRQNAIIEHIRGASDKADKASKTLGESIESVSLLAEQYLTSLAQINSNIEMQYEQVQSNKGNVDQIFDAIGSMSSMVEKHESLVTVTVSDVNNLSAGIKKTDELVKKSALTIRKLTDACTAADKDVADSSRFVDDLANYSKNIYEIVHTISGISEQTNILSINAAIEAARSGAAGKGFGVVAAEIRSLANQSGESAAKINEILSTMVEKIGNIQKQESLVSSRLQDIITENTNTESGMEEIYRVLENQLAQNNRISETMSALVETVHTISDQTANQKGCGEDLRQSLLLLETITDAILIASREQQKCNEKLKNNLQQIQSVSEENLEVIAELTETLSQ
ncbi:methyl-accepting chemotaxis protein [Treponema brennaborense]|uniref:Methyl-accepting chemotaxis sensory transducer n=1 Tax=Treponema brennaborense (strain DSM 12168 / CIP 105900 / DD5/3) TaxID=906968 RepID=F4LLY5_TREBD|nr:methyl-accepting chemotaxis protein [Treponema brennaborense]AEE15677.1 methyl-accepting chemotaxis sensory transducer [Treponema brennaborense DSM 12168]